MYSARCTRLSVVRDPVADGDWPPTNPRPIGEYPHVESNPVMTDLLTVYRVCQVTPWIKLWTLEM
jgi:hypothetical protein